MKKLKIIFIHFLAPILFCIIIGGMVGWGYKYGGAVRYGKIRHTPTPKLDWNSICRRKKDIKTGAVIGGILGAVIVILTYKNTIDSLKK